jgi:hypothetical protein
MTKSAGGAGRSMATIWMKHGHYQKEAWKSSCIAICIFLDNEYSPIWHIFCFMEANLKQVAYNEEKGASID